MGRKSIEGHINMLLWDVTKLQSHETAHVRHTPVLIHTIVGPSVFKPHLLINAYIA